MILRNLLVGVSAIAFAAGAASAQNVVNIQSTSTATPNNNNNTCTQFAGTTGNECVIVQNGTQNTAIASQNGNGNYSLIDQRTAAGGAVSGNYAEHRQQGDRNSARTFQRTNNNFSRVLQLSSATVGQVGNSATVTQQGSTGNSSDVQQNGRGQTSTVTQTGFQNSSGVFQGSFVQNNNGTLQNGGGGIGGIDNVSTVVESGSNLQSTIFQFSGNVVTQRNRADVTLLNNAANLATPGQLGNNSFVFQLTSDNTATIAVANGDSIGAQGGDARNFSNVQQGAGSNNEASVGIGNPVNAALASQNSSAGIFQFSTGGRNYGEVTITGGVSGNDPGTGPNGANTINRSGGNVANINQNGTSGRSTALVTIGKVRAFNGLGNNVNVNQNATAPYGNQVSPAQGSAATPDRIAVQESRTATGASIPRALTATGQYASVYAQGRFGTVNLSQTDNAPGAGTVYRDADGNVTGVARARANIFIAGELNTTTATQNGDNYADITQGRLGGVADNQPADRGSTINLTQTDAGDAATTQIGTTPVVTTVDEFGNPSTSGGQPIFGPGSRDYNQFIATQYGVNNTLTAQQNARNAFMNVFQGTNSTGDGSVGVTSVQPSGLYADLQQGTGNTANFTNQGSGRGGVTPPLQAGFSNDGSGLNAGANSIGATLNFTQGGVNNGTQAYQDSTNSVITIRQLGTGAFAAGPNEIATGAAGGAQVGNIVFVQQQGSGNRATAIQSKDVGRSLANDPNSRPSGNSAAQNQELTGNPNAVADDFFFAGGARSSQITILQGGLNNRARAEQNGKGQFARIEQAGSRNEAGILQEITATNATAIIRQSGTGNTYFVDQTAPGQYIAVDQSGMNNSSNQIVSRGSAGGTAGFTPFAGFPGF